MPQGGKVAPALRIGLKRYGIRAVGVYRGRVSGWKIRVKDHLGEADNLLAKHKLFTFSPMQTASEAKFKVLRLKALPPLSATASRLLELLTDENLSLGKLAQVIARDPGIAARILGVANSAYFGQTSPVHSVEDAVIRVLGLNMVRSLAFSISVARVFETSRCREFDLENYWYHSLATAILARLICNHMAVSRRPDPDGVYLAGLLFDIGILVLVHLFPAEYAQVLREGGGSHRELGPREEALVGISGRTAGAWLADRWHLPEMVVQVVEQKPVAGSEVEVALVSLAADWVRKGFQPGPGVRAGTVSRARILGLSESGLEDIKAVYLRQDEEIRSIAGMLVN